MILSFSLSVDSAFPHVVPNTSQHYEYSTVSFDCKEFDVSPGWKLMRKATDVDTACGTSWGVFSGSICIFRNVYIEDSGQYWCESGDGKKGSPINITISRKFIVSVFTDIYVYVGKEICGELHIKMCFMS